jgi:hypothetical protein
MKIDDDYNAELKKLVAEQTQAFLNRDIPESKRIEIYQKIQTVQSLRKSRAE